MSLGGSDRVVIVGGGLAGTSAAQSLRALGHAGPITIVDREPAFYDRPPLSKAALVGAAGLDELRLISDEQLAAAGIAAITGREVVALDPVALTIALDDGTVIGAEQIVLASGGRARRLAFAGSDAPIVHTLRTYADAQAIRAAIHPGATVLVVGAGLVGAELASSLRSLGAVVVLVDPVELPLAPAVGEHLARHLHAMHPAHEVGLRVGGLAALELDDGETWAVLGDGERIRVDAIVVGVGMVPNAELAEAAGLEVEGGVIVDEQGATSAPGISAIGDVARRRGPDGVLERREEHWEAAQQAGQRLAAHLMGAQPAPRGAGWWWSDRYGVHVEGVGRMTGEGAVVIREGGAHPSAFYIEGDRLLGAVSIDDPNTVRAARRIIDQGVAVEAQQLADPAISLRAILRSSGG